ncbi:MAG TPA: YbdK family carboxylate-amine ligase, partial [Xanthomonadales bacterium]|nr:YbdK family carboxylate-amine ligase [Xanthomonadales bacterium]
MPTNQRPTGAIVRRLDAARHDYSFGIEEEYFLVRVGSGELVREMPGALMERLHERFAGLIGTELLQSQVEARTPVCRHPDDARMVLGNLRRGINAEAIPHGLAILSAGTHPSADWRTLRADPAPRHAGLVADFALIARRNAVCGMHVHVSPPPGVDRVAVMNRVVPWTPLLLALSASSPFWTGELTGLASYRQSAYDEWPRSGTPPDLRDEPEYDRLVAR